MCVFKAAILFAILTLSSATHSQVVWQKHPANPIIPNYAGGGYALDPVVIFDSSARIYRMWFTGKLYSGPWSIHYAVSFDGITFFSYVKNPVLQGGSASFEMDGVVYAGVVHDGTQYRMYYTGVAGGNGTAIGLATSPDGIHWTKHATNPVLRPSATGWDALSVGVAEAVHFDGNTFFLYYQGYDGTHSQIGLATSIDGTTWVKHPSNPVLTRGGIGSWDEDAVVGTGFLMHQGLRYLFYTGSAPGSTRGSIGFASSSDGITWTKYAGNPVLVGEGPGSWDWTLHSGFPVFRQDTIRIWYSGTTQVFPEWSIGYATSRFTPVNVWEAGHKLPLDFVLQQNYPNPFNPTTAIEFSVPKASFVTLRIYDVLGREITTLVSDLLPAGHHRAQWNAGQFASGVYFYRIAAGDYSESKKLVLQH